jgi:uncharacterized RDD family membrane protein YckC
MALASTIRRPMDAGWYNDPFGRFAQRYHDGDDWSEHVSYGDGRSFADPSGTDPTVSGPMPSGPATWAPPSATDLRGPDLASPWLRLAASLLDGFIVGLPISIVTELLFGPAIEVIETTAFAGQPTFEVDVNWPSLVLSLILGGTYYTGMVAKYGRTLGKMVCGMTVADAETQGLPSVRAAFVRWVVTYSYILIVPFIVTAVMIFSDPRRQTLHDKAAHTIVLRTVPR